VNPYPKSGDFGYPGAEVPGMDRYLFDRLLEWEQRRDEGKPATPEELCADRPNAAGEVREWIRRLDLCAQLLTVGVGGPEESTADPCEGVAECPPEIAGFEIRGVLGRGGMGVVYDGWDPTLLRRVAVKVLQPSTAHRRVARPELCTARFERERQVLARLEDDYVVPVYQAGVWAGRPYIAMAFVPGGPLSRRCAELTARGPRAVAAFMEKVARGVQAAHQAGVLHRDLKPGNILVDGRGNPRVVDFGLAKFWAGEEPPPDDVDTIDELAQTESDKLTRPGVRPGTPPYMAPEQYDPRLGRVGPATDVWALGVVLFELLSGRRPFAGDSVVRLADQVCREPAPTFRGAGVRAPRWLEAVVARCLAKSPDDRFATAGELADALHAGLRPRRRMVAALALGSIMLAVVVAFIIGQRNPPEKKFEDLPEVVRALNDLENGKEVVLIDENRRAPFHELFGESAVRPYADDDGPMSFRSKWPGEAAVELLPRLPPGSYQVKAVVRHSAGDNKFARVSVYVAGQYWKSARGKHLGCLSLAFADVGPGAEKRDPGRPTNYLADFRCLLTGAVETDSEHWDSRAVKSWPYLTAVAAGVNPGWRTLVFEVTPTAVTASWDGRKPVGTQRADEVATRRNDHFAAYPALRPADLPADPLAGGIGLTLNNATIDVKDFRVTPLMRN
jgi:serine/threonine protein kinase